MKQIRIRYLLIILMFLLVIGVATPGKALAAPNIEIKLDGALDPKLELLKTVYHNEVIQAWHYSGNYWRNEKTGDEVKDELIRGDLQKLEQYFIKDSGYPIDFALPYEVINAINQGKKIVVKIESAHTGFKIDKMMKFTDKPEKYPVSIAANRLKIMMHPSFNYQDDGYGQLIGHKEAKFDINLNIPFVKQMYGVNTYSVFGNGLNAAPMASSFTSGINNDRGDLHFSRINPKTGAIHPGYSLKVTSTGKTVSSAGLRVGQSQGVFGDAGAFGLSFNYPLNFHFYLEGEGKSDMIMREMELIDDKGVVIESFKSVSIYI